MKIGDFVEYGKDKYFICGLSTMIYDDDCDGEPEWKITKTIQEVALVEPFSKGRVYEFHKPLWVRVTGVKLLEEAQNDHL